MARTAAGLPAGIRLSDHISLGVIARTFPLDRVQQILAETGKASERERDLPAQVMVYYAIALALYMTSGTREVLRCLLEGLRWLWGAEAVRVAGKSGISQARTRLGEAPLRCLYEQVVQPVATCATRGAWYRQWRLVSLDGSCLDVADTEANRATFGRPEASPHPGPACGRPGTPAVARAPSRSSASWPWSRTARTCCSVLVWAASRTARPRWPMMCCRRSGQACCA
jgi:Insertion element 4 transposase N-terminal